MEPVGTQSHSQAPPPVPLLSKLVLYQRISPSRRPCETVRNFVKFVRWGVVSTMSNSQAGGPPLIGCLRPFVRYICSCPPYLEDVSPSATGGCATVWLQGPTFYGDNARTFGWFILVSNNNSSDFIVLLSHYFFPQSSPQLIYLSYLGTSCSVPYC